MEFEDIQIVKRDMYGEVIDTFSARDFAKALKITKGFSPWSKESIEEAGLIEGKDYVIVKQKAMQGRQQRNCIDVFLSLRGALLIAFNTYTDDGQLARDYFIELYEQTAEQLKEERTAAAAARRKHFVEQTLKDPDAIRLLVKRVVELDEAVEQKDLVIEGLKLDAEDLRRNCVYGGPYSIKEVGWKLAVQRNVLVNYLQKESWFSNLRRNGRRIPHRDKVRDGLMDRRGRITVKGLLLLEWQLPESIPRYGTPLKDLIIR